MFYYIIDICVVNCDILGHLNHSDHEMASEFVQPELVLQCLELVDTCVHCQQSRYPTTLFSSDSVIIYNLDTWMTKFFRKNWILGDWQEKRTLGKIPYIIKHSLDLGLGIELEFFLQSSQEGRGIVALGRRESKDFGNKGRHDQFRLSLFQVSVKQMFAAIKRYRLCINQFLDLNHLSSEQVDLSLVPCVDFLQYCQIALSFSFQVYLEVRGFGRYGARCMIVLA